jgi:hypothetical protein
MTIAVYICNDNFRVRNAFRRYGTGTEPADQIPVGTVGPLRQEGDAVPQRGTLRGERG